MTFCNFSTPLIQKNKSIISYNFFYFFTRQSSNSSISLLDLIPKRNRSKVKKGRVMKVKQVFVLKTFVHISLFSFFICLSLKEWGCWNGDFSNSTIIIWQILQNAYNGEGNEFSQRSPLRVTSTKENPCCWFLLPFSNCPKWEMYSATSAKLPETLQYQPFMSCGAG